MKRKKSTGALKLEPERRKELQSIVEAVHAAMKWPVSLWVIDEEIQALRIAAAVGVRPSYVRDAILPLDKPSVTGDCFDSGQPVVVPNIATDKRWKYEDEAKEVGWKSYLCVPVRVRGNIIGALGVYTFVERSFPPFEQQLLTDYASWVGHAVESERRRQALRRLLEITRTMEQLATEKPQAVLKQIVRGARDITGADCVVLYPYDPTREDFYETSKVASSGLRHPLKLSDKPRQTGGMAAHVKEQKEVIVENIPEEYPDMLKSSLIAREGIQAFMGIALEVTEGTLGILYINFQSPHKFQEEEKDFIRLFARQIAVAVRSSRLFEQATSRAEVLQRLHQIGEQLLSAELPVRGLRKVLRQVARSARSVLKADLVDVYQYIEAEDQYVIHPILEGKRLGPSVPKDDIFEDDVVARIVQGEEPSYSSDAQGDPLLTGPFIVERPNRPDRRFVVREGVLSSAAIPLRAAGETVGVMFVNYRKRQAFTPDQKEIIELFANQAAMAIYNARAYEQIQKRIKALEALNEVGQRLSTVEVTKRGLSRLLKQVARQAKKVLGADLVELYRYSPGRDDAVAAHASAGKKLVDIKPPKNILPDDVAAKVLNLRIPIFAADAQSERLLSNSFETNRTGRPEKRFVVREKIVSAAAVPLIVGDEAVGVLFVNYRTPQRFEAEQRELIHLFASQAAAAIRNAQLFQQREALQNIAHDITSVLNRDKLLQRSLERSLELLNCEVGSISVYDPTTETLEFQYAVGKSPDMSVKLGEGLIGTAADTRKAIRVGDVSQDKQYRSDIQETQSEMDIPMLVGKRLIGVLNTESKRLNAFSEADQRLAEALAAQVAVAFRTTELYEEAQGRLQERVGDIEALQNIYALIVKTSPEGVLEQIAEEVARLTPAKYTGIWLLDEQARELRFGAMNREVGTPTQEWPRLPLDKPSINAQVALTGKTYLCNDVKDDPYYQKWYEDVESELTTPLLYGGRVIGTLNLESTQVGAFTKDHVRLVEALSEAAAVAIQSARLYERLDTLARVGQTVTTTLDLSVVLDRIMHESVETLAASRGTLRLLDRTTGELTLEAYRGNIGDRAYETIKLGDGIVGWVAEHGEAQLVPDVHKDVRYVDSLEGTCCELAVPIKVGNRVIGVLNIEHPQAYAFDEHDLHLLEAIASQAATSTRNAQLYEAMQTVNEVGQALTGGIRLEEGETLDRLREEEVLELIHGQASKLMDTDNMYIALYDETTDTVRFGLAFKDGEPVDVKRKKGWQPRQAGKGKTEEIIRTKDPILHMTEAEARAWYDQTGHKEYLRGDIWASWLGVPMMVGDKTLGVVASYHPNRDHVYDKDDLAVLQAMANQAAIALDNAHMFYDVNKRLKALVGFGQDVTSDIRLGEQEVLDRVYKQAKELMNTDNMYIALYDEATDVVRFGLAYEKGKRIDFTKDGRWKPRKGGKGRTEYIIRTKESIINATRKEAQTWYDQLEHEEYVGDIWASYLGVPMTVGSRVMGVIAAYHIRREHVYGGEDLGILQALANQAAIALENVRLLKRREGDIQASRDIDRAIVDSIRPGPDLQRVLELILNKALERTGASSGNVMWYDEATGDLVLKVGKGILEDKGRARQEIGEGIVGLVARDRKACRVGDVTEEPWREIYIPFIADIRSELATPLMDGETLLGVLNVEDPIVNAFDEEDSRWLEDLAVRAVIAIRSAQLYEALEREQERRIAGEKFGYLGSIAAGLAHRVNSIGGMVRVCERELRGTVDPEDKDACENLDIISEETENLLVLAKGLFRPTQALEEQMQLTDLNLLLKDAVNKARIPTAVDTTCTYADGLPSVLANKWFVELFVELTTNAVKAMNGKGQLGVGSRLVDDNWVEVWVCDTGCGIPPEDRERIFDLFYAKREREEKEQVEGFGFGLWWIKTFLIGIGGSIDFESETGVGTTFVVRLPIVGKDGVA